jgi:hypothetical protein
MGPGEPLAGARGVPPQERAWRDDEVVPDAVARFMACDARVQVMTYQTGQLIGINPSERLANRATRRYLARRDQGCAHPLCDQKLWLHAHHIVHWEEGGPTVPSNLLSLCPFHHRALHLGLIHIEGDPEPGTLRFLDAWGDPIAAPDPDPPGRPPDCDPPPLVPRIFTPPLGERLRAQTFSWN